MKLHNTLTRQTEEFKPIESGQVKLYTCGPTVYDHVHIGNFRTYLFEDLLRRTLKNSGYSVTHVMNITDVDDKTINRSLERYPNDKPKDALQKLTSHYERVFLADAKLLGIDFSSSQIARATEHIPEMQALIKAIPGKYIGDDGIYYDLSQDDNYGMLINLEPSHERHRINNDEYDKEHAADFALWKIETADVPIWEFELEGKSVPGHPGWHIECSAISTKYLGQPFDIHTGGVDLIFPHHENEIAQNRAANGQPLANYFVHAEHLLVEGNKMSKSAHNFYTVEDISKRGIDPLAFRLLLLQSHYRSQMNFSWESLEAAQANLKSLQSWADQLHQATNKLSEHETTDLQEAISSALQDDLNSAMALAAINNTLERGAPSKQLLEHLDSLFALGMSDREDIAEEQKALIAQREEARAHHDYAQADHLRQQLAEQGIELNDTDSGPLWLRA